MLKCRQKQHTSRPPVLLCAW